MIDTKITKLIKPERCTIGSSNGFLKNATAAFRKLEVVCRLADARHWIDLAKKIYSCMEKLSKISEIRNAGCQ